ncbi:MAG TPA: ABC transporter substrate-binding protein [Herpetosiphonaceae bacterium]
MRRLFDLLALLIVAGYVWLAAGTESGAADPVWRRATERGVLVAGSDAGFRPFAEVVDGQWRGYDIELVNEIGRRLGLRVEWRQVGYDALFSAVDAGNPNQVDLLAAGIVLNPGEAWRASFSRPYFDAGQQAVAPVSGTLRGLDDLAGRTVAVQLGSGGETALRAFATSRPLTVANQPLSQAAALELALAGGADAAVVDNASALPYVQRGRLRYLGGLTFEPYVLALPVAGYQLRAEIDRVLAELEAEGWIAELNRRWFP